jgi:hypothetical protein
LTSGPLGRSAVRIGSSIVIVIVIIAIVIVIIVVIP